MQVVSSSLNMNAAHQQFEMRRVEEQFEVRASAGSNRGQEAQAASGDDSCEISDAKLLIVNWLYEHLTGKKPPPIRGLNMNSAAGSKAPSLPSQARSPVSYARREIFHQEERSTFQAAGTVTLASGQKVEFSLELNLNRELTMVNGVSFQAGKTQDPLVINLDGAGVRLTGQQKAFDLDGNGVSEMISSLAEGSAWLAVDRNGNGKIDNGTELFGPKTGSGFGELAALDRDASGWVDSGDAAYANLGLWDGSKFTSLAQAGIGALSVDAMDTPFRLYANGAEAGQVKQTAVYLREDGTPGAVQEIDLRT